MLNRIERDAIVARESALRDYLGKRCSYKPEEVAHLNPPTNEERSAAEVFDFCDNPPDKYFLYVSDGKATTWTGENLGRITFGREYRDNFGGKRVPIWFDAINGEQYHGTYFKSAGDYARVKMCKAD